MNSTVAIVGTASTGISLLSGDAEYVRRRAIKRQRNRANRGGIVDGILDGSESLISGITSGIGGLVTKPFEEVGDVIPFVFFVFQALAKFLLILFPSLPLTLTLSFSFSLFHLFSLTLLFLFNIPFIPFSVIHLIAYLAFTQSILIIPIHHCRPVRMVSKGSSEGWV